MNKFLVGLTLLALHFSAFSTDFPAFPKDSIKKEVKKEVKKQWYETFAIRGYMQVRYNRLLETNSLLKCEQCDRSMGEGGGFFVRRMRLIFSGNVGERVYLYFQPDFASSASSTGLHFGQVRDMYMDVAFDKRKNIV